MCTGIAAMDLCGDSAMATVGAIRDVSFNTHRMMRRLRKASFLLYQSEPFSLVVKHLEACRHGMDILPGCDFFILVLCRTKSGVGICAFVRIVAHMLI